MIKPVIKENKNLNKAFLKSLKNAKKEDLRERALKKIDLKIEFT